MTVLLHLLCPSVFKSSNFLSYLHSVVADACVSMDEWVTNPTAHTALDDVLPCVDNATAQETSSRTKETTYRLATVVNRVITNVSNKNYPPIAGPLYFNQSGPLLPVLCNPFNSDLTDRQCSPGEAKLQNATEVILMAYLKLTYMLPASFSKFGNKD